MGTTTRRPITTGRPITTAAPTTTTAKADGPLKCEKLPNNNGVTSCDTCETGYAYWPCNTEWCVCEPVENTTTEAPVTTAAPGTTEAPATQAPSTTQGGSGGIVCTKLPNNSGVTDCSKCETGYEFWPCNTEYCVCEEGNGSTTSAPETTQSGSTEAPVTTQSPVTTESPVTTNQPKPSQCPSEIRPNYNRQTPVCEDPHKPCDDKVIFGYFAQWGIYGRNYQPTEIPANKMTHLLYSFFDIDASCNVASVESYPDFEKTWNEGCVNLNWNDHASQKKAGNIGALKQMRDHYSHLKLLFSLGGWTLSKNFSKCTLTDASRKSIAKQCADLIRDTEWD